MEPVESPFAPNIVDHGDDEIVEITQVAAPNMEEDVREQKELIAKLKLKAEQAKRKAAQSQISQASWTSTTTVVGDAMDTDEAKLAPPSSSSSMKRIREEESVELKLEVKPKVETEQRVIKSNSRIRRLLDMPPERKSLAWGTVLFALGMSAVCVLLY